MLEAWRNWEGSKAVVRTAGWASSEETKAGPTSFLLLFCFIQATSLLVGLTHTQRESSLFSTRHTQNCAQLRCWLFVSTELTPQWTLIASHTAGATGAQNHVQLTIEIFNERKSVVITVFPIFFMYFIKSGVFWNLESWDKDGSLPVILKLRLAGKRPVFITWLCYLLAVCVWAEQSEKKEIKSLWFLYCIKPVRFNFSSLWNRNKNTRQGWL